MHQEEPSEIEPEPLESQSIGSTSEPSPELKPETPEEEDSLPPEFLRSIEYDISATLHHISVRSDHRSLSFLWIP